MDIRKLDDEGVALLAEAVVAQAAKDYLKAKKDLFNVNPLFQERIKRLQWKLESAVKFFRSKWYRTLCGVDADYLLKKLDEEFEEWVNSSDKE